MGTDHLAFSPEQAMAQGSSTYKDLASCQPDTLLSTLYHAIHCSIVPLTSHARSAPSSPPGAWGSRRRPLREQDRRRPRYCTAVVFRSRLAEPLVASAGDSCYDFETPHIP